MVLLDGKLIAVLFATTVLAIATCSFQDINAHAQSSDSEVAQSLKITEVELSPPATGERDSAIRVEVHNPTNRTFSTPVEIRTLDGDFSFLSSSKLFQPNEYIVFDVWDTSHTVPYPNENVVLLLYTSAEETDRTPPLTDTFADSRTWQLMGTEWVFAEETLGQETQEADQEWLTHYAVSDFVNTGLPERNQTGSPDPRQIFKIHYRVVGGTLEDFSMPFVSYAHYIQANVISEDNDMLQILFPKNYPIHERGVYLYPIIFFNQLEIGETVDHEIAECFYAYSIPNTGSGVIDLVWTFQRGGPFIGLDVPDHCTSETLVEDVVRTKDGIIAPFHQVKAGVKPNEVVCSEEFELIFHPNGRPFCATPSSAEILKQRWNGLR